MKNIKLNKDQQKIFDFINNLPINKSAVVLLTGTAGSGKTTLIGKLNEKKGKYDEVIVSSLTGKAAQVLRSKDIKDAKTIASFLNGRPKINLKLLELETLFDISVAISSLLDIISSKDGKGNVSSFKMIVNVNVKVFNQDSDLLISTLNFNKDFVYNNQENKSNLDKYK